MMERELENERLRRLQREADDHNAKLVPEHEGYVRMDGSRRQYRAEIRGGEIVYVEQ